LIRSLYIVLQQNHCNFHIKMLIYKSCFASQTSAQTKQGKFNQVVFAEMNYFDLS